MDKKQVAALAVLAIVVVVGGVAFGMWKGSQRSESSPQPTPSTSSPSQEEPNDDIAAQGGQGPRLTLTGWDAPIGRGGTLGGVMDTDLQNKAVEMIGQDFRARHTDAPDALVGNIKGAKFDAGPQILTFVVKVDSEHYDVRVETAQRAMHIAGPDGKQLSGN